MNEILKYIQEKEKGVVTQRNAHVESQQMETTKFVMFFLDIKILSK